MADLNALIAQGVQFKAPPDPFAQYAQMQQLQQGEQANRLGQMQMQEYQRGMEETNAMRRLDPSSATYLQDITRINPEKGFAFAKMQREAKSAGTEGQIKDVKLLTDKLGLLREEYREANTPEKYVAVHQKSHADPVLGPWFASIGATPEQGFATIQKAVSGGQFNELRLQSLQKTDQLIESMKPQPDAALMKQLGYPQTPEGFRAYQEAKRAPPPATKNIANVSPGDFTPASLARFNTSGNYGDLVLKPVDRPPRQEQPLERVIDSVTGKPILVSREEAVKNRMTPASAEMGLKPLTELQTIKLRTDVAKDYKTATTTLSQMDDLLESIDRVKTAPGLSAAAGYTGKLPSFPGGAAAQAETRLANLRGKVTALGKSLASATGAIGSIATQEWKVLADQVANLDETKGAGPLLEQISLIEEQTAGAIARIRDQYEKTRSEDFERFPQFRDLPASKKPGKAVPSKSAAHPPDIQAIIDAQKRK
jgi:hypothetical protein